MRPFSLVGMILIVVGVLSLVVRSFTYFTTEHMVGPLGFFAWETSQPHTIFFSPLLGLAALIVGIALVAASRRGTTT